MTLPRTGHRLAHQMESAAQRHSCQGTAQHSVAQPPEHPLQLRFSGALAGVGPGLGRLPTKPEAVLISPAETCLLS